MTIQVLLVNYHFITYRRQEPCILIFQSVNRHKYPNLGNVLLHIQGRHYG